MSKTTKVIAALGVVAGLGVAALPAFTYADDARSVTANTDLYVEVEPAIAMTITGNNDAAEKQIGNQASDADWKAAHGKAIDVSPTDSTYIDGVDWTGKRNTTTIASSSAIKVAPNTATNGAKGAGANGFLSTVTVYTNNKLGYKLAVKAATADDVNLRNDSTTADPIVPVAATGDKAGKIEAGSALWGYKVNSASTDGSGYSAITASDVVIDGLSSKTAGGNATEVYYGVSTKGDQETGIYSTKLTYTATCFDNENDADRAGKSADPDLS